MKAGVVIGSYGMPGVVELNVSAIRHTCGPVPILIADDCTPESEGRARLACIAEKWGTDLVISEKNNGHARGDVIAFQRGIEWAMELGLDVLAKFSQRFILTATGWLQNDGEWLIREQHHVASQAAHHLGMFFPMRTEAVLMAVASAKQALSYIGKPCITAAESHIHAAFSFTGMEMARWQRIPPDRFHHYRNVIWHNSSSNDTYGDKSTAKAYYDLADDLGVDLGQEFSGAGWHIISAHRPHLGYSHFR